MRDIFIVAARLSALLVLVLMASACAAVDASYAPRTDQVTHDVGDQRDRNTLINIIRASRYETLNFTALSKYTAGGSLQLTSNLLTRSFAPAAVNPSDAFGPNNAAGTVSSSFDLGSLENRDFYIGFLSPIKIEIIDFLLSSGISRELLLHATIAAIEFKTKTGRSYRVYNDPTNDLPPDETGAACGFEHWSDFEKSLTNPSSSEGVNSCLYSKFRYMLYFALRHGVATHSVEVKSASVNDKDDKSKSDPRYAVKLCFEPSLVDTNLQRQPIIAHRAEPVCDAVNEKTPVKLNFPDDPFIGSAVPIFRSPYGVFQYLGSIVRGDVSAKATTVQDNIPREIFPYRIGYNDCFIFAEGYCITNDLKNGNAKQMIALLNALVAINVNPQALPITPSVQLTP